jgi:probable HAF family extracellular repeat protein
MKTYNTTQLLGMASGLLAAALMASVPALAAATTAPNFQVLDNPGDPHFNQLLGINDSRIIVGYFGDGTAVPNNGYLLIPRNHYSVENFTNLPKGDKASQTQAIGINNNSEFPKVVGFYTDNNTGFTHGFLDFMGTQITVDDPEGNASRVATPTQNLLGVNDQNEAAGFWMDNSGHSHGFVVLFNANATEFSFTEIPPSTFKGAVSTQASNINTENVVCGFWTDANGASHGFFGTIGKSYTTFNVEIGGVKAASTQAFGCNNNGDIVGQFADTNGYLHGFIYHEGKYEQFDAPGSSQVAEFGVQGTLINGINDFGDIVGFYSDGKSKVNSFVEYTAD